MPHIAVVTGAGSGVGRSVVEMLATRGWNIALIGRRQDALDETISVVGKTSAKLLPIACDVGDPSSVHTMAARVRETLGAPDVLVNSAGTNIPKRSLADLSIEDYNTLIGANLNGTFYCVHEFLPMMRSARRGVIVNIVSDAGLQANGKAGVAYIASKFGQRGLTQSINLEERANGIRACAIFPGEINTPILDKRPNPPPAEARVKMLQPEDVAKCVMLAIELPDRAVIEELLIRPR
jgi:NAD(P)-dependent dehydrogenase (short-subunit alcohol dehydrogenase family)